MIKRLVLGIILLPALPFIGLMCAALLIGHAAISLFEEY